MDPLAVLAYGAEQTPSLIGMEWNIGLQEELSTVSVLQYCVLLLLHKGTSSS